MTNWVSLESPQCHKYGHTSSLAAKAPQPCILDTCHPPLSSRNKTSNKVSDSLTHSYKPGLVLIFSLQCLVAGSGPMSRKT